MLTSTLRKNRGDANPHPLKWDLDLDAHLLDAHLYHPRRDGDTHVHLLKNMMYVILLH